MICLTASLTRRLFQPRTRPPVRPLPTAKIYSAARDRGRQKRRSQREMTPETADGRNLRRQPTDMSRTSTDDPKRARTRKWLVVDAVLRNRSARRPIPVDSEKNREFSAFLPFSRVALAEIAPLFRTLVQHFPLYENREFLLNETGNNEHRRGKSGCPPAMAPDVPRAQDRREWRVRMSAGLQHQSWWLEPNPSVR